MLRADIIKFIIRDKLRGVKYRLTHGGDYAYFQSLKNSQKGKRGFVIGNGPSLKLPDLECLQDEVTIASNKIYLAFDQVKWRPSYYTVVDPIVWSKIYDIAPMHFKRIHIPQRLARQNRTPECMVWRERGRAGNVPLPSPHFSTNFSQGVYAGATVTVENIQLAFHLGLNPIYIIGCDHFYSGEENVRKDQAIETSGQNNHFIKNYREKGEVVNPAPIEIMNQAYAEMSKFSAQSDTKILNATRGGYLDQFKRVRFDSLFQDGEG